MQDSPEILTKVFYSSIKEIPLGGQIREDSRSNGIRPSGYMNDQQSAFERKRLFPTINTDSKDSFNLIPKQRVMLLSWPFV